MNVLVAAARACAAEMARRSEQFVDTADMVRGARAMVDGDLYAGAPSPGLQVVGETGPDLGGYLVRQIDAERIVAHLQDPRPLTTRIVVRPFADGERFLACGCGFEVKGGVTVHHHCARHLGR